MDLLLGAIAIASLMVGIAALVIACIALIDVKGIKSSTHSIQYINPLSEMDDRGPSDKELEKQAKRAGLVALQEEDVDENDLEDL